MTIIIDNCAICNQYKRVSVKGWCNGCISDFKRAMSKYHEPTPASVEDDQSRSPPGLPVACTSCGTWE